MSIIAGDRRLCRACAHAAIAPDPVLDLVLLLPFSSHRAIRRSALNAAPEGVPFAHGRLTLLGLIV